MECVYPHDKNNKRKSYIPIKNCPPIRILIGKPINVNDILEEFYILENINTINNDIIWNDDNQLVQGLILLLLTSLDPMNRGLTHRSSSPINFLNVPMNRGLTRIRLEIVRSVKKEKFFIQN